MRNIQGTATVHVSIGPDGKVEWAEGVGAHPLLTKAAEDNVRRWTFGPFPADAEFPVWHEVTYIFKLEGKPLGYIHPPLIITHLPDRIELITAPFQPAESQNHSPTDK